MKIIPTIISYCSECHHAHPFTPPICRAPGREPTKIPDYPRIPDWCPLQDYKPTQETKP